MNEFDWGLVDSRRKVPNSNIPSIFPGFYDYLCSTEPVNPSGRTVPGGPQHTGEPKVPPGTSTFRSGGITRKEDCFVLAGESEGSDYGLWKSGELRNSKLVCTENMRCEICGQ